MTRMNIVARSRATRGGTFARVLLIVLGSLLALFGLMFVIAGIALASEGDSDGLPVLLFSLLILAGGILLIVGQVMGALKDRGQQVAPEQVIPQGIPTPVTPGASQPTGENRSPESPTKDVANLVSRSEDLFATLRDLVRHESTRGSDKRHLATMLDAAGVLAWPDAPACEGGRLTRNNHFWIRLNTDDLTDEQYDTLVSAEAALGLNQDLPDVRKLPLDDQGATSAALDLMRAMCDQQVDRAPLTEEGLRVAYGTTDPATHPGEWVVRSAICHAAECVRTPFRVVFDLRANVSDGLVVLGLEIPRPRCMAIFTPDAERQVALARAYALRLAALLARYAFAASDAVHTVVVDCHERGSEQTLLSLELGRAKLETLLSVARGELIEQGFPTDDAIRTRFEGSWFAPVEPFVALDSPAATPATARTFPELDSRETSEAMQRTCHARRVSELGINENAARVEAWESVREQLGTTTKTAVSALVAARDATHDITVAEACTRCVQALVDGSVEIDDLRALGSLFVDGSALDLAVRRSSELLDDTNGHEDPEAAVRVLEAALAPIDDMGAYLDDETTVYRYFGSVAERVHHNAAVDEGGREIRLVPDAYYNAHCNASIAHGMLEHYDEALAHAEVCLRIAPTSTHATMRKVRVLESQSRIYEAADLIIEALRHAVTPRDAAICHYRLAYMEWKLGREDLAAACYQRSLSWDTEMAPSAREELDDLIRATDGLERPTDEQADALLAREGIPLGCIRSDGERTLAAAVACMDHGAFYSARPLMAVLFGMNNDDVVMGVYRSLSVSS